MFLHIEMEKGKPGRSAGKRKGVKDHGQSPSRAVCCRLVCTLETCGDYAPNLNLQSRSAEVRGERAAPYSLLPRGFRPLTTRGPPFATLLPILFRPGARRRLSGLPPALAPARLPQAQCACTCSQSLPSGPGNPRAPASGAPGLTLACTQLLLRSREVTATLNNGGSREDTRAELEERKVVCVCMCVFVCVCACVFTLTALSSV